eukprot:scaffold3713_cov372-Prasinococcus_capsulatus_cf.AAC.21
MFEANSPELSANGEQIHRCEWWVQSKRQEQALLQLSRRYSYQDGESLAHAMKRSACLFNDTSVGSNVQHCILTRPTLSATTCCAWFLADTSEMFSLRAKLLLNAGVTEEETLTPTALPMFARLHPRQYHGCRLVSALEAGATYPARSRNWFGANGVAISSAWQMLYKAEDRKRKRFKSESYEWPYCVATVSLPIRPSPSFNTLRRRMAGNPLQD